MSQGSRLDLRRRDILKSGAAASASVVAVSGCLGSDDSDGGDGSDDGEELTITLSQFPDTIDPLDHITGDVL